MKLNIKSSKFIKIICFICIISMLIIPVSTKKARAMSVEDFLNTVGPMARADMERTGILASLTMAQAILESGWGTSTLAINANALFGMKATNWSGATYWYDGVSWRAYGSWQESVNDHGNHLSTMSRYANLVGETNYVTACYKVVEDGYCPDPGYAETLIGLIEKYNLTQFDGPGRLLDGNEPIYLGENFVAYIRQFSTGNYLTDDNGNIVCAAPSFLDSQKWHFIYNGDDGSYSILSDTKNLYFDVPYGDYRDNASIWLCGYNGLHPQRFFIYFINGQFFFRTVGSRKVFDVNAYTNNLELCGEDTGRTELSFNARAFEILKFNNDYGNWYYYLGMENTVYVRNTASGKMMTASGSNVIFTDATYENDQKWIMKRRPDGSYEFLSVSTGWNLDVLYGGLDMGTSVDLCPWNGLRPQGFYILPNNNFSGSYYIKPCYSHYTCDMDASTFELSLFPVNESSSLSMNAQSFEIVFDGVVDDSIEPSYLGDSFDGYLTGKASGMTLTDMGNNTLKGQSTTYGENQLFHFEYDAATASYKITGNSGKCIDVTYANYYDGSVIGLYDDNGWVAQRFRFYSVDGYYYISPVYTNRLVDIHTGDNSTVQLYGTEICDYRAFTLKTFLLGDASQDGIIDSTDYLKIKAYILKEIGFDAIQFRAADVDKNGSIDATDYLKLKSHFLGIAQIG